MSGSGFAQFIPLILIFVIFYFFLIRPQQKRIKDHKLMVDNLKRGDKVITSGGTVGTIERIIDACQAATISMGIFGINAEAVLPYKEKGFNLLAVGIDTAFLISSAKDTLIKMKD